MTPRKRLSVALKSAARAARANQLAQNEMHEAFEEVYGEELDLEGLAGEHWVDALVYGNGATPNLSEFDAAVEKASHSGEADQ